MSSSTSGSKIKEFELSLEFQQEFGFIRARVVSGYLILHHKSDKKIRCKFDHNNLPIFKKRLESAIAANESGIEFDTNFDSRKFVIKFIELLSQDAEEEYIKNEAASKQEQNEKQMILDEINKTKISCHISLEDWEKTRKEKFDFLYKTVKENLPTLWLPLEFALSIKCIINIAKITLPFAGIVLGAPSTLKTVSLTMLNKWPQTYYTDHFTSRSLVSHSTAVAKEELTEIDMLPRWKNKFVLLPELAPIFTAKDEDLTNLLGILTRVLDGQGYQSDSGAHGHRGYDERIMFVLAGASVEIPRKVYRALGYLGPKLYFLRLPHSEITQDKRVANLTEDFSNKEKRIQSALFDYLKWLEIRPDMQADKESDLFKIEWDDSKNDRNALKYITDLADLLAPLRGVSQTWETRGSQGFDYGYTMPIIEDPSRAATQLYNLARGHALSHGRNYVTKEDLSLVIKVVLSTGPIERTSLVDKLIDDNGDLTTGQIAGALNVAPKTARKTMIELTLLGLVDMYPPLGTEDDTEYHGDEKKISLKPRLKDWLETEEFRKLRQGFVSIYNSEDTEG